jgi:hypothetical protein
MYIQMKGCNFHHKQAIRSNLQEKGLMVLINNNSKFEYLIKMIYGLAFIPPIRVGEILSSVIQDYVKEQKEDVGFQEYEEGIKDFLSYYERTWIGAPTGSHAGGRKVPRYYIESWNKYAEILEDRPITNNTCEGYNSGWANTMNKKASLFNVLEGFLNKESWSQQILCEDSMEVAGNKMEANKRRSLEAIHMRLDLMALVRDFDSMMPSTWTVLYGFLPIISIVDSS